MVIAATGLFPFSILFFSALGCILLSGLFLRTRASVILVFACVALVSACRFMVTALPLSEAEINRLQPQLPMENVQLVGRVLEPPEYHAYRSGNLGVWVFPLECEGLRCGGAALECAGPLREANDNLRMQIMNEENGSPTVATALWQNNDPRSDGKAVSPFGCHRTPGFSSPSTINQSTWLTHRGRIQVRVTGAPSGEPFRQGGRICFTGTLRKRGFPGNETIDLVVPADGSAKKNPSIQYPVSSFETLSGPPRFSPLIWGQRLRESAARTLSNGIENHMSQLAVYKALLLGYRKAIPPEIHQRFKRTGTLHIFAISGLHVGIVGMLITVVLKSLGLPRDRWGLLLLPLLLGYVVATGMKSSALRALAMAAVYFLSPLFRRKPDVPVSIAFAAILLLFCKPLEILSAGFIYSFTVVSFIVMLFATVPKAFIFRGAGWLRAVRAYVASLGVTSIAASIGSIPVTALFFGSFTPVSLVGNLIVVPLTFCIVLSGWLSILVPATSGIFNYAALVFINGLLGTVGYLSSPPGAFLQVPPPPLTALLFWYSGWIYLFAHARTARQRTASFALITLAVVLTFIQSR